MEVTKQEKGVYAQEGSSKSKNTPPYLSVAKLSQLFGLVSSRNFSEINHSDLKHYGFGDSDIYIAIGTLRFLGIIDRSNKVLPAAKKLHLQGSSRTEAIAEMTRSAYAAVFDRVPNLVDLPPAEMHNEFLIAYGITPRVAKSALPAFLWLCEQGGLRELPVANEKRGTKISSSVRPEPNLPAKRVGGAISGGTAPTDSLEFDFSGGIKLVIPKAGPDLATAIAQGELKRISDEINEFARKYLLNKTEGNNE
jgi:hypothetical protein